MKLTGDLKKKVEESASRTAKRAAIEDAGMELTDNELNMVAGGSGGGEYCTCDSPDFGPDGGLVYCNNCNGLRPHKTFFGGGRL